MNTTKRITLLLTASLLAATTSAQEGSDMSIADDVPVTGPEGTEFLIRPDLWRAESLIGREVETRDGVRLGSISDVVVDLKDGLVNYAVVDDERSGGSFAVRMDRFRIDMDEPGESTFVLDFSEPEVDRTPRLGKEWPADLLGVVHLEDRSQVKRVTKLMGITVENWLGDEIGTIDDLVLDCDDRYVAYAVLELADGYLGRGERYFAVPAYRARFDRTDGILRVAADPEEFRDAPTARVNSPGLERERGTIGSPELYWPRMGDDYEDGDPTTSPFDRDILSPYRVREVWWLAWDPPQAQVDEDGDEAAEEDDEEGERSPRAPRRERAPAADREL